MPNTLKGVVSKHDTSYINGLIDHLSNELKFKLNAKHQTFCMHIDEQHKLELEQEKKAFSKLAERFIQQVDSMQSKLDNLQKELKRKDKIINNLTTAINKKNKKFKLMRCFHDWKNNADSSILQSKRQLLNELDEMKKSKTAHVKYESNLKSALLRGISALNLETASVFGSTPEGLEIPPDNARGSVKNLRQPNSISVTPNPFIGNNMSVQQSVNNSECSEYPMNHGIASLNNNQFKLSRQSQLFEHETAMSKLYNQIQHNQIKTNPSCFPVDYNCMTDWAYQSSNHHSHDVPILNAVNLKQERIIRPMVQSYFNNHSATNIHHHKRLLFDSAKESWNLQIKSNYLKKCEITTRKTREKTANFRDFVECNHYDTALSNIEEKFQMMDHLINDGKLESYNENGRSSVASVFIEKHNPVNSVTRAHVIGMPQTRKLFTGII